jgi:hypothetical protein
MKSAEIGEEEILMYAAREMFTHTSAASVLILCLKMCFDHKLHFIQSE